MNREIIYKKLSELLVNKYGISEKVLVLENYNEPLTGRIFNFDGIDLTYLFFVIQDEFKLHINPEQILNYEFNSINGIARLVEKSVNKEIA